MRRWGALQINKQFNGFVKRVQQDVWERDFGCAAALRTCPLLCAQQSRV